MARWRAILHGRLRVRACRVLNAISAELEFRARAGITRESSCFADPSLQDGLSGLALFFSALAQAQPGKGHEELMVGCRDRAFDLVASRASGPGLFVGFTGVALAAQLLARDREVDAGNGLDEVDSLLISFLERHGDRVGYDLVDGLVGYGVYGLERLPRPKAARLLRLVVRRLAERARRCDDGVTWHTAPEQLVPEVRRVCPEGHYNLGLAHGVPGVIALLGPTCAAGIAGRQAYSLLDCAVRWVLARYREDEDDQFGAWLTPDGRQSRTRTAWCYGDAGVAAALHLAGQAVGERAWVREAVRIATVAARRNPARTLVEDAGFCHGSAGLAHIWNRFYQSTGEERFGEAARFWIKRTLQFMERRYGAGPGLRRQGPAKPVPSRQSPVGLLTGSAGIGLTLMAAVSDILPTWDRVFAISARQDLH